jgi:succinyl-CoA synthetase alpha subunit
MNIQLFKSNTPVMIQGITGKEGSRMTRWLKASGVNIVAGVSPGHIGETVEGCTVFETVADLKAQFPDVAVSSIVVPAKFALGAVREAILGGITFVHLITEKVPVHDVLAMRELAESKGASVLGPSSVGYLQFPAFRLGYLGGESPFTVLKEGNTAVISTSGGMTNELMMSLSAHGIGVKIALALGGDRVTGMTLEETIHWCEALDEVKLITVFIEPGRPLLRSLVNGEFTFKKPAVLFLAGEALDDMPRGLPYGHTGTVLGEDDPTVKETRGLLKKRGLACSATMSEFITACKTYV